jgi:hypothetical protein
MTTEIDVLWGRRKAAVRVMFSAPQARLGHASITMTADRYSHLFPSNDDGNELAAAERLLVVSSGVVS